MLQLTLNMFETESLTDLNACQHLKFKVCLRLSHPSARWDVSSDHMLATGPSFLAGHLEDLCPRGHFQHHTLQAASLGNIGISCRFSGTGGVRRQAQRPPLCRGQVIRTLPGSYHRYWHRTSFHLQSRPFSQYLGVKNSLRPGWPRLFLSGKLGVRNNIVSRGVGGWTTIGKNTHRLEVGRLYRLRHEFGQMVKGGEGQARDSQGQVTECYHVPNTLKAQAWGALSKTGSHHSCSALITCEVSGWP